MLTIQKNLSKRFYVLASLPATAMGFALSVQISALSWILSTQYGLNIHEVGLVWAAGPIAGIFGQVIIGLISDKVWFWHGRRRPFIIIGGVLAGLMLLALPNIDIVSSKLGIEQLLPIALIIALTLDLAINVSFNPTRSLIADVTPEGEQRTSGYTWMQFISGSFGILAYAIGAIWGNIVLIYLGAVIVLLLSIIPPLFITEPKHLPESTASSPAVNFKSLIINIRPLWGFIIYDGFALVTQIFDMQFNHYYVEAFCLLLTLLLVLQTLMDKPSHQDSRTFELVSFRKVLAAHSFSWIGVQTMFVFIFVFLQNKMPPMSDIALGQIISIAFLILSIVAAYFPALVLEPLAKRMGRVKVHTWAIFSMSLGYLAIALWGENKIILYLLMAVVGIGWSSMISLVFAIVSEQIEQRSMGTFMGLFNLSVVLPQLLVSLAIGLFISQVNDKSAIFYLAAACLLISALCWSQVEEN